MDWAWAKRSPKLNWEFGSPLLVGKGTMRGKYVLRVYMSAKHMTANVVEGNQGRVVASASTVEHAIRDAFEWGRGCNAKAAASVGEVLAMRLKTEEAQLGVGGGVHIDVEKEIEKKGVESQAKLWAIVNALRNRGVKVFTLKHHS
ncbi:uncharacterized protein LOC113873147 [Abrus precatorius]|uniref:Uncharacterized protein LOC113873147 n=1 Tax=Abrus precatorius TaxID=3816 RepID=A0A8B8ME28_ABRPR|nr:uncharacterized protein LOC113873147 [Abrus precatorius]